jgi:hypothetical protein
MRCIWRWILTEHTLAKINKLEQAANDAGLLGEWQDISFLNDILSEVYGGEPETKPVRVRSTKGINMVLDACYS